MEKKNPTSRIKATFEDDDDKLEFISLMASNYKIDIRKNHVNENRDPYLVIFLTRKNK